MTDIEQKALALVNQVSFERVERRYASLARLGDAKVEALCRALERHEAFKQEVSDAAEAFIRGDVIWQTLGRFIIPKPKPDPLVEVIAGWTGGTVLLASDLRAALEARGLEIREKGQ
jgi:hypothetical protein